MVETKKPQIHYGQFLFIFHDQEKYPAWKVNSYYEEDGMYHCKLPFTNNGVPIEVEQPVSVNDIKFIDLNFEEKVIIPGHKPGYTFAKWSEVVEMVRKERKAIERHHRKSDGVFKFHYHGLILVVNDDRIGDARDRITLSTLKDMINEATREYPNGRIEISLEGHYDWWPDYQTYFEGGRDTYEPSDIYIDIELYKNF